MQWIAPSEQGTDAQALENRLWAAADQLRANSGLTSAQYSQPVLGLIFLCFAEVRFLARLAALEKQATGGRRGSRVDDPTALRPRHTAALWSNFAPPLTAGGADSRSMSARTPRIMAVISPR